ncbi:hypothetical protein TBK1r_43450 [Stieleria magnilauensis]|uniref:Uncharacterized protein n=1 Tax=Stieleria magnilauensis TaxID=2527963 RepID=A0ABX5XTL4_9BACT|nr:hypothetical protein TBK1r_43450 [Planctomycetes bacterium TBK1r]
MRSGNCTSIWVVRLSSYGVSLLETHLYVIARQST